MNIWPGFSPALGAASAVADVSFAEQKLFINQFTITTNEIIEVIFKLTLLKTILKSFGASCKRQT